MFSYCFVEVKVVYVDMFNRFKVFFEVDKGEIILFLSFGIGFMEVVVRNMILCGGKVFVMVIGVFGKCFVDVVNVNGREVVIFEKEFGKVIKFEEFDDVFRKNLDVYVVMIIYNEILIGVFNLFFELVKVV